LTTSTNDFLCFILSFFDLKNFVRNAAFVKSYHNKAISWLLKLQKIWSKKDVELKTLSLSLTQNC